MLALLFGSILGEADCVRAGKSVI